MTEKKTQVITINDKEYNADDLTNEQKLMVNHCTDLDRKMASAQFNLDQLRVGKDAFVNILTASLDDTAEDGGTIEAAS
jgi:hypothetical protein|tara:strand:+ start:1786 stop:2022 length:237 start_codon:yes stop_codon:yes gene_type:complete